MLSRVEEVCSVPFVMGVNPFGITGDIYGYDKRAEFDSVRSEERFCLCVSKMKRFCCEEPL